MEETQMDQLECNHCKKEVNESVKFCENCGYPQHGTASEKSKFHADRIINNSKSKEAGGVLRKARNTLFFIAALSFGIGLFYMVTQNASDVFITYSIMALIYLVLGFWSQKKPLIALVLALLVYLTTTVISGIVDPATIYKGIIIKVFIIVFLAKGINSALHVRKMKA